MAQDHIWAPLAEGQPTHHREPGQMIYLQDTEAAQFYYILTGTVKCFISRLVLPLLKEEAYST